MDVVGFDHVQVAAPRGCEAEARRFYGNLLGLVEVEKPESLRGRGGVWFRCGEQQLHVGVEHGFAPARKAHPAIRVAAGELDALAERLRDAGEQVVWDVLRLRRYKDTDAARDGPGWRHGRMRARFF
jgi:catechol 2,3-dioxygenase-like lactoylglutathione lyase family enzyme